MGGGIGLSKCDSWLLCCHERHRSASVGIGVFRKPKSYLLKSVSRGKMSEDKAAQILSLINPTLADSDVATCNMVVEAVVELESVKKQVLPAIEALVDNSAVITSNTSTISINRLAEVSTATRKLRRHALFLIPYTRCRWWRLSAVDRRVLMPLSQRFVPMRSVWVRSRLSSMTVRAFLVNRVLFALLFGLEIMITEGADFQQIDKVMERVGPANGACIPDGCNRY